MKIDLNQTLTKINKYPPNSMAEGEGGIEKRYIKLVDVPLNQFSMGDIRFLIGQEESLDILVPIALDILARDIFIETEYYPGDLLSSILNIENDNFWSKNKELRGTILGLHEQFSIQVASVDLDWDIKKKLKQKFTQLAAKNENVD